MYHPKKYSNLLYTGNDLIRRNPEKSFDEADNLVPTLTGIILGYPFVYKIPADFKESYNSLNNRDLRNMVHCNTDF